MPVDSIRQYDFEHDDPCRYCDGECVPWESLPTHDMGNGVCEWCGRAITKEWPAAQTQDDDDTTVMHYHNCPYHFPAHRITLRRIFPFAQIPPQHTTNRADQPAREGRTDE